MKLLFTRHGETDWNVQKRIQGNTDTELNETGILQARQLGLRIASQGIKINHIYSSRLKRAYKTATIVSEYVDAGVQGIDGLEEINLGRWEGMTWSNVEERFPKEYEQWYHNRRYHKVLGGESYQDLLERVMKAIHKIMKQQESRHQTDAPVLIVTHSADIVTLLAAVHNVPFEDMFQRFKIGNTDLVELESEELDRIQL